MSDADFCGQDESLVFAGGEKKKSEIKYGRAWRLGDVNKGLWMRCWRRKRKDKTSCLQVCMNPMIPILLPGPGQNRFWHYSYVSHFFSSANHRPALRF